ncbi:hypothetical protein QUF56_09655 [Ureibacillus composti]|nr:hypothetical protein [Ureibacillus composti]
MKTYTYTHPQAIEYTGDIRIFDESNEVVAIARRIYDHIIKRKLDRFLDFRYFLKYEVDNAEGKKAFLVKKKIRRGRLWFEGLDVITNKKYMITYENWRIGIPELYITDGQIKLQLNKEFEEWSEFLYEDQVIARWKASFVDEQFDIILQIDEKSPIQSVEFFVGISQATLFVGA